MIKNEIVDSERKSSSINEVMFFIENQLSSKIKGRIIKVFTSINWDYLLLPSVSNYLFEDINIIENLAPLGQKNRPGEKYKKYYICVHDTGDHNFNAYQWSEIVKKSKIGKSDYTCSFQYVVGNDGYYHNIPDDEMAKHAGDGHSKESLFGLIPSGVYTSKKENSKPNIGINNEGYYTINEQDSKIKAPTNDNKILNTKDINDLGIYSELKKIDEDKYEYYLGRTWYNPAYNYIANYGGNLNSIGIETCVNKNSDIYYSWQKVAKLVAKLMDDFNLDIDSVVQHHYFSGKNCPKTKRKAGLWEYFKQIILIEFQMLQYKKEGYNFLFKSKNLEYINDKGRVLKKPEDKSIIVEYEITVNYKNIDSFTKEFKSEIFPDL